MVQIQFSRINIKESVKQDFGMMIILIGLTAHVAIIGQKFVIQRGKLFDSGIDTLSSVKNFAILDDYEFAFTRCEWEMGKNERSYRM